MIQIIKAKKSDIRDLNNITSTIWQECLSDYLNQENIDKYLSEYIGENLIAEKMQNGYDYFLCLNHNEELIGYALVKAADEVEIETIAIFKDFRGYGYGTQIIDFITDYYKNLGYEKIFCEASVQGMQTCLGFGFKLSESEATRPYMKRLSKKVASI